MPRAASSVGIGRRVKRETALVSCNDLDATLTGNINDTPPSFEYCWLPLQGQRENFTGLLICIICRTTVISFYCSNITFL